MASPITAFVEKTCEEDPQASVTVNSLWLVWKVWADRNGVPKGGKQQFGRNLRAAYHWLRVGRPRHGDRRERVYYGLRLNWQEESGS